MVRVRDGPRADSSPDQHPTESQASRGWTQRSEPTNGSGLGGPRGGTPRSVRGARMCAGMPGGRAAVSVVAAGSSGGRGDQRSRRKRRRLPSPPAGSRSASRCRSPCCSEVFARFSVDGRVEGLPEAAGSSREGLLSQTEEEYHRVRDRGPLGLKSRAARETGHPPGGEPGGLAIGYRPRSAGDPLAGARGPDRSARGSRDAGNPPTETPFPARRSPSLAAASQPAAGPAFGPASGHPDTDPRPPS